MLRQSYTAVVERAIPLTGEFSTEPYEVGWAREALIFFKIRSDQQVDGDISARVQISPDGIDWVNEGTSFPKMSSGGLWFVKVNNFGNWLRIAGTVSEPGAQVRALVYIVAKE